MFSLTFFFCLLNYIKQYLAFAFVIFLVSKRLSAARCILQFSFSIKFCFLLFCFIVQFISKCY